jgi:P27 family predicted phage terminase small subunit
MAIINPPSWLPKESQSIFKTIVKLMSDSDVLEPTDVYAVALLSDSLYTYQECVRQIAEEGNIIVGDRGQSVKHPCHTIKSTTFTAINTLFTQLGLSPSARKKLEIAASQVVHDDSHLAQFTK